MGTPEFALPSLSTLLEHSYSVPAVVTVADKPQGRGQKTAFSPVKQLALDRGLEVLQPESLADADFHRKVTELKPDLIVVVAFRILPREVYSLAPLGAFNLHASLLPKYRGAAPINWAVMNGETETGVTTFFLREPVDTGSILLQARVRIGPDETAGDLHDKLALVGAEVVLQTVRLIESGRARPQTQKESDASKAPKIFKDGCKTDWSMQSVQIHNFVRGLSPVPTAWTTHNGRVLKLYLTRLPGNRTEMDANPPGTVLAAAKDELIVRTGDGAISIIELQQEGRKRMRTAEFLRGYDFRVGDLLQ